MTKPIHYTLEAWQDFKRTGPRWWYEVSVGPPDDAVVIHTDGFYVDSRAALDAGKEWTDEWLPAIAEALSVPHLPTTPEEVAAMEAELEANPVELPERLRDPLRLLEAHLALDSLGRLDAELAAEASSHRDGPREGL